MLLQLFLLPLLLSCFAHSLPTITSRENPASDRGLSAQGEYIISFQDSASDQEVQAHYDWLVNLIKGQSEGKAVSGIKFKYVVGNFRGYSGRFEEALVEAIRGRKEIQTVEADTGVSICRFDSAGTGLPCRGNA